MSLPITPEQRHFDDRHLRDGGSRLYDDHNPVHESRGQDWFNSEFRSAFLAQHCLFGMPLHANPQRENLPEPARADAVVNADDPQFVPEDRFLSAVSNLLESSRHQRIACELTAGIDSRLLLACCQATGCLPSSAFTLGFDNDDDVEVAKRLAESLGIDHHVIPVHPEPEHLVEDAIEFVRASGWQCNATSYAWLPAIFRRLNSIRDAQITGAGGEVAGGFYATPFDSIYARLPLRVWVRTRLQIAGNTAREMFRPQVISRAESMAMAAVTSYESNIDSFRAASDRLYADHRVVNWGLPVLRASSGWYKVIAPLLLPEYRQWVFPVSSRPGLGRQAQLEFTRRLSPKLATIPYGTLDSDRRHGPLTKLIKRGAALARFRDARSDLGAQQACRLLLADDRIRKSLARLCDEYREELKPGALDRLLRSGASDARTVGAFVTAALALCEQTEAASEVKSSAPGEPKGVSDAC